MHQARVEAAERTSVVVDLRDAEVARLELLNEALDPLFAELPPEVELFDRGVSRGDTPRLWIDSVAHIAMGRDKRAYRFLHDDSGHIVAERRKPELETFLGLRYPATDIPVQARRLFTLNRLRFIPDLGYRPAVLEPSCGPKAPDPLDLSQSMLRTVSPVHVEYLQNMGITASMSVSIVVGGSLWGLFACHHYGGARLVPHAVRVACTLLAQVVSVLVERIEMGGALPINTHGGQLGEAYIHGMNGIAEGVRQVRGTSCNQVEGVDHVLVTAGTGVPTSGIILGRDGLGD